MVPLPELVHKTSEILTQPSALFNLISIWVFNFTVSKLIKLSFCWCSLVGEKRRKGTMVRMVNEGDDRDIEKEGCEDGLGGNEVADGNFDEDGSLRRAGIMKLVHGAFWLLTH